MTYLLLSFLLSSLSHAAVFGKDDRLPVSPFTPFQQQSSATAVAVLKPLVSEEAGKLRLETDSLSYLCPEEPFHKDPSLSFACTGFLESRKKTSTAASASSMRYLTRKPRSGISL